MQQKNPLKAFVAVVFVILIGFLGFTVVNNITNQPANSAVLGTDNVATQNLEITVVNNKSEQSVYAAAYKENTTLFSILKELQDKNTGFSFTFTDSTYGAFINSVNGYTTDVTKEFWEIMINGKSAEVGISDYFVKPNDKIELKISQISSQY